ncbi:MAG: hypothetical protein IJS74_01880 [Clostridia bacterium]|nr:hypothetical protein [Clostridia bacterium]
MAEEVKVNKTKTTRKSGWMIHFVSFIAVVCIGVSLILSKIGWFAKAANALSNVAQIISYVILILISGLYVVRRKSIAFWIAWGVSVALIIVYFFI